MIDDDAEHLDNILHGGLLKKVTPPHIEERLIKNGYVYKGVGGLVPTHAGHTAFMTWKKENK